MIWKTRRETLNLTQRGQVMGILNVTPDSFSDGGNHLETSLAIEHARQMIAEGARIIDIGGESTRPGATPVTVTEEINRAVPVVLALRKIWDGLISVDTTKAAVAEAALIAGADIVNDVSGLLADPEMAAICATHRCGVVVMHMQGNPQSMQINPHYLDVAAEVREFFIARLTTLTAAGIDPTAICFDPGIGFGKSLDHNLTLLCSLKYLDVENRPLLLGVSRKSFLGKIIGTDNLTDREWPTVAITANARDQGVMLHRVHAVKANVEALRMVEAILGANARHQ
jgi:dihydropteroate synthase